MRKPLRRSFTEEEFCREMQMSGFLGAYKFWTVVCHSTDDITAMRRNAEGVLCGLAKLAWEERRGTPGSPQEEEAFRYCGLTNVSSKSH
jgi:hypothetical protein